MASFQDDEIAHDILALLGETPTSSSSRSRRSRSGHNDDDNDSSRRRSRRSRRSRNDSDDEDDDSDVNGSRGAGDDDDDRDPWGPDLIGDSRDRAYLDSLPELEREKILADRADQRQRREERRAVAEKLREQQSQRPSRRSESNSAAADKKRKLQALKEKRTSRRSNRYSDSDSDYNEDRPSTRKRHRRDNDRNEDDDIDIVSDTDDRDPRRSTGRHNDRHHDRTSHHHRDHRRGRSNSPAYDPAYSPTRNANDRSSSPRRNAYPRDPPLTLAELNGMMLTRTQIAKYCYADFFEDLAREAFVRLRVGDNSGEPVYRVCQIVDVTDYKRPYSVQTVRTNKSFLLKHGSAEKVFLADIFSDTPFTQSEFDRWRLTCESESVPLPTKADALHKAKDIAQAEAHIFTDEEISLMVKKKMQLPGAVPRNYAAEKSVLIKKLHLAKANGDRAAVEEISNQLREIDATVEAKVFGNDDSKSTAAFARRREGGDTMLASAMGGKNIFKNPSLLERKRPAAPGAAGAVGGAAGLGALAEIPGLSFAPAGPPLPDLTAAGDDDDDEGDGGVLDLYKSAPKLDLDL